MTDMKRSRKILRPKEVQELIGKSRVQIWRDVRAGRFPAPISLGPNSAGFYQDEILAWLESRPRVSYAPEPEAA
jgi:prophage regulatory protein